jgi:hypothetical protein
MSGLGVEEITLQIEMASQEHSLPANFNYVADRDYYGNLIIRTWADFPTLQLQRHTVSFPRDWWQAVKERWAPRWALRRWPVVYTEKVFDARLAFPDYALPETLGRGVSILLDKPRSEG